MNQLMKYVLIFCFLPNLAFGKDVQLKNGVTLSVEQEVGIPRQTISMYFLGGNGQLAKEEQGSGGILTTILDRGPKGLSAPEYKKKLFMLGGDIGFGASTRFAYLRVKAKPEKLSEVLALALETLANPKFDEETYSEARSLLESSVARREDNMGASLSYFARRDAFAYHPDILDGSASKNTLKNIDFKKVQAVLPRLFNPERLMIASIGPQDPVQLQNLVEQTLDKNGLLQKKYQAYAFESASKDDIPNNAWKITLLNKKDAVDNQILYVVRRKLPVDTMEEIAWDIANSNLGRGSAGRLFQQLREKEGLTYGVNSGSNSNLGMWFVTSFASTEKVAPLMKGIERMVEQQSQSKLDKETFERIRAAELRDWKESRELLVDRLSESVSAKIFARNLEFIDNFDKHLEKVSLPEVDKAASKYMSLKTARIYLMGDKDKLRQVLKGLGYKDKDIRVVEMQDVI